MMDLGSFSFLIRTQLTQDIQTRPIEDFVFSVTNLSNLTFAERINHREKELEVTKAPQPGLKDLRDLEQELEVIIEKMDNLEMSTVSMKLYSSASA